MEGNLMLVIKCIEKIRDSKGRITHYKIQDTKGNTKIVTAKQLKVAISNMQVNCVNLTLTSDNRLIDKEDKNKINSFLEELDREKIRHKKLTAKVSLLGSKLGDTTYRINNAIYEVINGDIYLKEVLIKDGEFEIPEFVSGFCKETVENKFGDKQIISHAFRNCRRIKLKNRSSITDMSYLFSECLNLESIDMSEFDTSKVVNMSGMFNHCAELTSLNVSNFDTSKVVNMSGTFNRCVKLGTLDISNFDTSNVTSMQYMFYACANLKSLNISHFNTSKVIYMYCMFSQCNCLAELDASNFDTSNVIDMGYMFSDCPGLKSLDISGFSINNNVKLEGMFRDDVNLEVVYVSKTADEIVKELPTKKCRNILLNIKVYKK